MNKRPRKKCNNEEVEWYPRKTTLWYYALYSYLFTTLYCKKTTRGWNLKRKSPMKWEQYQSIRCLANLQKCNAVPHNFLHSEAICSFLAANQSVEFSLTLTYELKFNTKKEKIWKIILKEIHFHYVQFSFIISSSVPFSRLFFVCKFLHMPWNQCRISAPRFFHPILLY